MYINQNTLSKRFGKNLENLTEVKCGETGTGLLIEHDGHVLGNKDMVSQIKEDIEHHKEFVIPDRFVVNAIFQKFGIKNANGRIYPEDILKREVDKYINERVRVRASVGALDHPECQLPDTQILTENGWVKIQDVKVNDSILTLNEDKVIEIHPVIKKIESEYCGKMIRVKNRSIDLTVTPNHKFPVFDRNYNFKGFYTAQEMADGVVPDQSHCYLMKTGEWKGKNDKYFVLPALDDDEIEKMYHQRHKNKYSESVEIPMDVWAKFFGIYLSEGCVNEIDRVSIYQVKEDVCNEIEDMLDEFPLEYHINVYEGKKTYSIYDMRLAKYLKQFGTCYEKYIPFDFKQQSKETLKTFYDWFVMGDGRGRSSDSNNYRTDDVFSTSKQLVMDLNEIQLKIGYCGSYHEENRQFDRLIEGRLIEGKNCSNMHFTYRSLTKGICLGKVTFENVNYDGMVYCVQVENHNFYTMDLNGHCVWSGNSSTLSGHDVSHVITNLQWQGHTLIGEMELHLSPGYRRYGIASTSGDLAANMVLDDILIGVSSRGVGSVDERFGVLEVGDDFELIGWDIVLEPSTPNAYIGRNMQDLMQYVEANETRDEKPIVNEKIDRINKILL